MCLLALMHLSTWSFLKPSFISFSKITVLIGIYDRPMNIPPVILGKLTCVYHGCFRISATLYLFSGLVFKMHFIISLAFSVTYFGTLKSPERIFLYRLEVFASSNGKYPQIRANKMTPQDQMST